MTREAIIVGTCKVNDHHGLLEFWSYGLVAGLASGLGETRNLFVKWVKGVSRVRYRADRATKKAGPWPISPARPAQLPRAESICNGGTL